MIYLNTLPNLNNRTQGLALKEAKKRKVTLGYFQAKDINNFEHLKAMDYFGVILFDNAELAPRGHTPNSPIVDIIKALSANGCEVYVNCKDGERANEILNKTSCKLIRS